MSSSPRAPSALPSIAAALGAGLLLLGACFDSDEKYQPAAGSTSTTGPISTTSSSSSSTSGSSTTGESEVTCREAIDCVVGCAAQLQASMLPEPDLTCFLDCEPGLSVDEVLHLFRLTECVTNKCIEQGVCDVLVPEETSTGSSSGESSSSSSSSSSGSSSGDSSSSSTGPTQPMNPCLDCILANMLDLQLGGECQALADMCI